LAAGLRPDPLGEFMRSQTSWPQWGSTSKGEDGREGGRRPTYKGREGRGLLLRGREGRRKGTEREGKGIPPKVKVK